MSTHIHTKYISMYAYNVKCYGQSNQTPKTLPSTVSLLRGVMPPEPTMTVARGRCRGTSPVRKQFDSAVVRVYDVWWENG